MSCGKKSEKIQESEKKNNYNRLFDHIIEKGCKEAESKDEKPLSLAEVLEVVKNGNSGIDRALGEKSFFLHIKKYEGWEKFMLENCWQWQAHKNRERDFPLCKKSVEEHFSCLKNKYSERVFWTISGEGNYLKTGHDIIRERPISITIIDGINGKILYDYNCDVGRPVSK